MNFIKKDKVYSIKNIKVAQYTFYPKEQKLNIFSLNAFTGLSITYNCNT